MTEIVNISYYNLAIANKIGDTFYNSLVEPADWALYRNDTYKPAVAFFNTITDVRMQEGPILFIEAKQNIGSTKAWIFKMDLPYPVIV